MAESRKRKRQNKDTDPLRDEEIKEIIGDAESIIEKRNNLANEDMALLNAIVDKWKALHTECMRYKKTAHKCITLNSVNYTNDISSRDASLLPKKGVEPVTNKSSACNIINITCDIWLNKSSATPTHICNKDWCKRTAPNSVDYHMIHEEKVGTVNNIYICEKTGTHHFCGKFCKQESQLINSDGIYVCKYSGMSFGESHMIDKFWTKHPKSLDKSLASNPYNSNTRRTIEEDFSDYDSLIEKCHLGELDEVMKKKKSCNSTKDLYYTEAIIKLSGFFSKKRFEEDKKMNEHTKNELFGLFKKYVNKKNQANEVLKVSDLETICIAHRKRKSYNVDMTNITNSQIKEIILLYAKRCLELWVVIRTRTPLGIKSPAKFPWIEFIESALAVFETGYDISGDDFRYRYTLIEKDTFLPLLPHNSSYLRDKSNSRKSKKNNVTKIQNNICKALSDAVINHRVEPESLLLSAVRMSNVDDDVFTKLRGKQKEKITVRRHTLKCNK
jgi:hypothetical protein